MAEHPRDIRTRAARRAGALGVGILAVAAPASAQVGVAGSGGGAVFVTKPAVTEVSCVRRCAGRRRTRGGSIVRVTGRELGAATGITFHGTPGRGDDVEGRLRGRGERRALARVPVGAVSGPVSVVTGDGVRSRRTATLSILPPPPPSPNPELTPVPGLGTGDPAIETGTSRNRAFVGARRAVTFSYRVDAGGPVTTTVELVRAGDGEAVREWGPEPVEPGEVGSVSWNGRLGRRAAPPGRYAFRLVATVPGGAVARSARVGAEERDSFDLYPHLFPIRGRHDYGRRGARFGSGRGGRSHQGQDVFARCGAPLAAARGGRVKHSGRHAAAGNYLVIDGAATGVDYVYMHLAGRSPFRRGDRVFTGQRIGAVGQSGNAHGCHLHFEMWRHPGWYDGGRPFDPLPSLRAWDAWS